MLSNLQQPWQLNVEIKIKKQSIGRTPHFITLVGVFNFVYFSYLIAAHPNTSPNPSKKTLPRKEKDTGSLNTKSTKS